MSWSIEGNNITLTRGDTLRVMVKILIDGEEYTPAADDAIRFAVKHKKLNKDKTDYADNEPLILKDITPESMMLILNPADTKSLGFGRYVYDCQITFADGKVATFIPPSDFILTEEVE